MPDPPIERTAAGKPVTNARVKRQAHEFKLAGEEVTSIMIHQLRIYEIFEHNKSAFHARFRDHAMRIMRKYGFDIVAMWETTNQQRTEFVYLLAWPDEAAKNAAWARFRADAEWKEIKRVTNEKHGDLVGSIEDRVLLLAGYSPSLPRSS